MQTLRNRLRSAVDTATRLRTARNVEVNVDTVLRRLEEVSLQSRVPDSGPMLTTRHRVTRLLFARNHINVVFSDESRL
jgi:hypothetical protein